MIIALQKKIIVQFTDIYSSCSILYIVYICGSIKTIFLSTPWRRIYVLGLAVAILK